MTGVDLAGWENKLNFSFAETRVKVTGVVTNFRATVCHML